MQNLGNSIAGISILGQFRTNLQFRDEKYLNTFIVTDANDCPNLLSHDATFRMGVLLPNYPKDMVVEGENVPHFSKMSWDKMRAPNGSSNVFQILGDIWKMTTGSTETMQKSRIGLSFQDHHTLQKHSTNDSDEQAGKSCTGTHISHTKYFTEWPSSTRCTCPQATTAGSKPRDSLALRKVQHHTMAGLL